MVDRRSIDINYSRGRRGRPLQRERAACFARETHCRKCGRLVNKSLPYRDPRTGKVNIWSKSYGHATELDAGGHPYLGHLEHLHCNSSAGARYGNAKRSGTTRRGKVTRKTIGKRSQRVAPDAKGIDTSADWS